MPPKSDEIVLFLHIPRTAGTSFNRAVRLKYNPITSKLARDQRTLQQFVDDVKAMTQAERREVRYFRGHFSYGVHELIPFPARYVTFVRAPIDRVISSYYFFLKDLNDARDITLETFIEGGLEGDIRPHLAQPDNHQVRMLAGEKGRPVDVPIGSCTREMLDLAKQRITSDEFILTGVTERFDESMLLLKERLGWKRCYYVTFNPSRVRARSPKVSAETRELIRSHNELDLELYSFALDLFEEQIRDLGRKFEADLTTFRSRNRIYNRTLQPLFKSYVKVSNALQR